MRLRIIITVLLSLTLLIGCSSNEVKSTTSENSDDKVVSETKTDNDLESTKNDTADKDEEDNEKLEEVEKVEEEITESELEELIAEQPLKVVETNYVVQSDEHKTLYPDLLQAIIENNSGEDIRDALLAFVAWDSNGLPLKLEANFDLSGGKYVYLINAPDINLPDGHTWGYDNGFEISDSLDVAEFKAIVVSYETFEDEEWKNEYFDDFVRLYEGQKRK